MPDDEKQTLLDKLKWYDEKQTLLDKLKWYEEEHTRLQSELDACEQRLANVENRNKELVDHINRLNRDLNLARKDAGNRMEEIEQTLDTAYRLQGIIYPQTDEAIEKGTNVVKMAGSAPHIARSKKELKRLKDEKAVFEAKRDAAIEKINAAIKSNEKFIKIIKSQLRNRLISPQYAEKFIDNVNKCQEDLKAKLEEVKNAKFDIINNIKHGSFWKRLAIIAAVLATLTIALGAGHHIATSIKNNNNNQIKQEETVKPDITSALKSAGSESNAMIANFIRKNMDKIEITDEKLQEELEGLVEQADQIEQLATVVNKVSTVRDYRTFVDKEVAEAAIELHKTVHAKFEKTSFINNINLGDLDYLYYYENEELGPVAGNNFKGVNENADRTTPNIR